MQAEVTGFQGGASPIFGIGEDASALTSAHLQLDLGNLCFLTHDVQQCMHLQASRL